MQCRNHPKVAATAKCASCGEPFCDNCVLTLRGQPCCAACKKAEIKGTTPPPPPSRRILSQARNALILAILGMFCAVIFSPLALAKASEARKLLKEDVGYEGEGMVTAAQIIAVLELVMFVLGTVIGFLTRGQA